MVSLPQWTLDELRTRYQLEPQLRDFFVEGTFDKDVYTQCIKKNNANDCKVYEIDNVKIESSLLHSHGFTSGNKQRVIVLARELLSVPNNPAYCCIVDRDLDHWFGSLEVAERLIWLEYCSLELYFMTTEYLTEVLIAAAGIKISDWEMFFLSLKDVLRHLYEMRLADRELNWALTWIDFKKNLKAESNSIAFDGAKYIDKLLMSNSKIKEKEAFINAMSEWKKKTSAEQDYRLYSRGHDLTNLLSWVVNNFQGYREFANERVVERLFVAMAARENSLLQIVN